MPRTGRPKLDINRDLFEDLCSIQCTKEEISGVLHVSAPTLRRWIKRIYPGHTFETIQAEKGQQGKVSLRRAQLRMAQTNATMAIWLGKQYLGQKDEVHNFNFDLSKATDEQLERIAAGENPQVVMSATGSSDSGTETPELASEAIQ